MAKHIVAKPIVKSGGGKVNKRKLYAKICYYYPQYKLAEVARLPFRDIQLLLRVAEALESRKLYSLTQIAAAPHTKKGKGVKKLTETFRKGMEYIEGK